MERTRSAYSDVLESVMSLRALLDRAFTSISLSGRSAPEIHRELKMDRKLAWKLSKFLSEDDHFQAAVHFPGKSALTNFVKLLRKAGVAVDLTAELLRSSEQFHSLVLKHAEDRASFDMMMLSLSDSGLLQAYRTQQKLQFSANSYLLGIQSKAQFSTCFFHPSENSERVDSAILRGVINLRRNRPKAPFVIHSIYHGDSDGEKTESVRTIPVENSENPVIQSCAFLREFCTKPLPDVLDIEEHDKQWKVKLADAPIGKTSQFSVVSAEVYPALEKRWATADEKYWEYQSCLRTPTEVTVNDLLVHKSLLSENGPLSNICQDITVTNVVMPISKRASETMIPCDSHIRYSGKGIDSLTSASIPDYASMVERVYDKTGWKAEEMHLFRLTIEYPVTPSSVYLRLPIPEKRTK